MRIITMIRLSTVVLPVVMGGCAEGPEGLRAVYDGEVWSSNALAATPYEMGKQHFAQGRYGLAVKHFQTALARDPESTDSMNALAASFDKLGRFDVAERLYLRALDREPGSVQSLNNLGYSYLMQRRYELAMTYLRAAQVRDPASAMVARNYQQAEAALDLADRSFVAAPVQADQLLASAQKKDVPEQAESGEVVHIWAVGARSNVWIERTTPAVQMLITQPRRDVFLAAEDAGVSPALANYRTETAEAARTTQPTPWEISGGPFASSSRPATPAPLSVEMPEVAILPDATPAPADQPSSPANPHDGLLVAALKASDPVEIEAASLAAPLSLLPTRDPTWFQVASLGAPISLLPEQYPAELLTAPREEVVVMGLEELLAIEQVVALEAEPRQADEAPALTFGDDRMPRVEVSNGTGRLSMALRMSGFLEVEGLDVVRLTNSANYEHQETTIFYREGWLETAKTVAAVLPAEANLQSDPNQRADIRVELGGNLLNFDRELFYAQKKPSSEPAG